jgi:hypothetical protein
VVLFSFFDSKAELAEEGSSILETSGSTEIFIVERRNVDCVVGIQRRSKEDLLGGNERDVEYKRRSLCLAQKEKALGRCGRAHCDIVM